MDFNNDGILDFILGERNGYYNFYTGNGDGTLHFIGHSWDNQGNPIQRGYNSAGYLIDWNEDGYIDFIAGGYNTETSSGGLLQVYLNTGDDITSPVWDASPIDLTSSVCNKWRINLLKLWMVCFAFSGSASTNAYMLFNELKKKCGCS